MNNELIKLNFAPGIKASDINYNFSLLEDWIEAERLRVGGWGICEGFNLSYDHNYNISVSSGVMINEYGKEMNIDSYTFNCGMPDYFDIEEKCIVDSDGIIKLKYSAFSPTAAGNIKYNPPEFKDKTGLVDITITDQISGSVVSIYSLVANVIQVDTLWAGHTVAVKYKYCNDQIDAILLNHNGNYYRHEGILSTSASKAKIDLSEYYIIGFARWLITETIDVEFIIDDRTYRKVYVNENNILYLNGKPYKEAQIIYFEEPQNPEENTLWYDYKNNALCIWLEKNGVYGWVVINDFSDVPIRRIKMWTPDNFPEDLQTFLFDDDETDLRYIPNTNALNIVIDQQTVMNDQFDELIQTGTKEYLSSGIGFKLKNPLDKKTYVQCTVNHTVRNGALQNVFQRAAIFITENYQPFTASNTEQIFTTDSEYCIGSTQLEVWIDGVRLNRNIGFCEILSDGETIASESNNGDMTKYYKVLVPLTDNQTVSYKISRYVWSYDQLNNMMSEIESKADSALTQCADIKSQIGNVISNFNSEIKTLQNQIASLNDKISTLSEYRKLDVKIDLKDLESSIKEALYNNSSTYILQADAIVSVANIKKSDVITINYLSNNASRQLIKDTEYTISYNDDGIEIFLTAELISPEASLVINTICFGKE